MATTCSSTAGLAAWAGRRTGSWWISCGSRTANWPSTGTSSRTRWQRKHPSAACRCSATSSRGDLAARRRIEPALRNILMSNATHETAPTEFVQVGGVRFAYRRFGRPGDLPLLLLNYFAATLDDWDPLVTNGLACEREVILFDNAGVGSSTGDTPPTVSAMTKDCVDFCRALDLMSFDLMGFSLGGMIAQQLAQDHPDMIRRMILLGAGSRGGEGMTFTELSVDELGDPVALLMGAFFTPSEASQTAGRAYIERLKLCTEDRDAPTGEK